MKILAVQNRMGIGDMVIFLPFIEAISRNFGFPVSILVKENSKAIQFLGENKAIKEIIILDRGNKIKNGSHDGIIGSYNLIKDLRKYNFDKIFIFNSSLRFNLIAKLANIKEIYQYPLFKKTNQHITQPAKNLIMENLGIEVNSNPQIQISNDLAKKAISEYNINKDQLNILLGVGGSGPTKRIPSKTFLLFMDKIDKVKNCKFFLATGQNDEEQKILNEIINSKFKDKCFALDHLSIAEILPIIKNCNVSVCNDTGFSHLSSALNIKTITLMADTPLIYGSYSSNMYPIIPDGVNTVGHDTLGKDKINYEKIFNKLISIIN